MSRRILQFGASRFLQAHADLFVHQAREDGQDIGPITIVKTTGSIARNERARATSDLNGFPIRIRGFERGRLVDEALCVTSVVRVLDAHNQWAELARIFSDETEIVFSNVADAGYQIHFEDEARAPAIGDAPRSFPAKLLSLLLQRFERTAEPLLILPSEKIHRNGHVLRDVLTGLALRWDADWEFKRWFAKRVTICDTMGERIVSRADDSVGAVAEPYALWAILRGPAMQEPFQHPSIVYADDLGPYLRLKLHILSLGHTYIADIWRREGRPDEEVVRASLMDPSVRARLHSLYADEVLPGFAARRMIAQANRYVVEAFERFDNPFFDHRVSDIFENHELKMELRVNDFIVWARAANRILALPRLEALSASVSQIARHQNSQARAGILVDA